MVLEKEKKAKTLKQRKIAHRVLLTSFPFGMPQADGMHRYALSGFVPINFLMVGKNLYP